MFYTPLGSKMLSLARTTFSKWKFQKFTTTLFKKMLKQGCQNTQLMRLLNKLFVKDSKTLKIFPDTAKSFTI